MVMLGVVVRAIQLAWSDCYWALFYSHQMN